MLRRFSLKFYITRFRPGWRAQQKTGLPMKKRTHRNDSRWSHHLPTSKRISRRVSGCGNCMGIKRENNSLAWSMAEAHYSSPNEVKSAKMYGRDSPNTKPSNGFLSVFLLQRTWKIQNPESNLGPSYANLAPLH